MFNPFTLLLLLVVVAALGWRGVRRERSRVASALKDAELKLQRRQAQAKGQADARRGNAMELEKDPRTGVYRPKTGA